MLCSNNLKLYRKEIVLHKTKYIMRGRSHLIIGTLATVEIALLYSTPITPLVLTSAAFFSIAADIDEPNSKVSTTLASKKNTKKAYKFILYAILLSFFSLSVFISEKYYLSGFIAIIGVLLIEKNFTHAKLRSYILSSIFIVFSIISFYFKFSMYMTLSFAFFSIMPLTKHRSITHSFLTVFIMYYLLFNVEKLSNLSGISFSFLIAYSSHLICDLITKRGIPVFYPISKKYISLSNITVGSFLCNTTEYLTITVLSFLILFSI